MVLTSKGDQKIKELFNKFPNEKIEKIAETFEEVHTLMSKIT